MLRRRSLRTTNTDLARPKPASPTHGVVLEHLDPVLAQRDAHVAACEAYARAQSRTSAAMSLFPPTPGTPEPSPRRSRYSSSLDAAAGASRPASEEGLAQEDHLGRRQSVRFVGRCSAQARDHRRRWGGAYSSSRSSKETSADSASARDEKSDEVERSRSKALGDDGAGGTSADERVPSPPRRAPPPVPLPAIAAGYLEALAAEEEYYTPEDDVASAPSSYRRLRGSRPARASARGIIGRRGREEGEGALPSPRSRPLLASGSRRLFRSDPNESRSAKEKEEAPATAPRPIGFLGEEGTASSRSRRAVGVSQDGATAERARPELPGVPEDESPESGRTTASPRRSKPSALFGSRNRPVETGMRGSLRSSTRTSNSNSSSSSNGSQGACSPDRGAAPEGTGNLRSKARKASRSMKVRLRSLFALARSPEAGEPPSLPRQHIEARRTHVTQGFASFRASAPEGSRGSVLSVAAKVPSIRVVTPGLVHSSKASLVSLKSEAEGEVEAEGDGERKASDGSSSSLTSWVHSGPSTLTSQQQQEWREWERRHLSVVGAGAGVGETTADTHAAAAAAAAPSSTSIRRQPLDSGLFQGSQRAAGTPAGPRLVIDSQRVYSALMKRMRALNRQVSRVSQDAAKQPRQGSEPGRSSSSTSSSSSESTPETIRCSTIPGPEYSAQTPARTSGAPGVPHDDASQAEGGDSAHDASARWSRRHGGQGAAGGGLLPAESEGPAPASVGAVASPASYLFRKASPYRRALRSSIRREQEQHHRQQGGWTQQGPGSTEQDSDAGTHVHSPSAAAGRPSDPDDGDSAKDMGYTESVYTTDDDDDDNDDTPTIYRHAGSGSGSGIGFGSRQGRESTASSVDWKTWLSANVGRFGHPPFFSPPKPNRRPEQTQPGMPRRLAGHVRERAQTHGDCDDDDDYVHDYYNDDYNDDDDVFKPTPPKRKPTRPRTTQTPLAQVQPNVIAQSTPTTPTTPTPIPAGKRSGRRAVLAENEKPTEPTEADEAGETPVPPPRSKLRPSPLRVRRHHRHQHHHAHFRRGRSSSPGLTEAVRRQFGVAGWEEEEEEEEEGGGRAFL